jgi:glycosyltransferase involved in cell wall biosynthesis
MLLSRSGHKIDFKVDHEIVAKIQGYKESLRDKFPRIGILVISYNASAHIESTLSRIPKEVNDVIEEIFIFDDCSPDNTYDIAKELQAKSFWQDKLNVYKNPINLRYGGNQKAGYTYAIDRGMDYVIMLHGDGQYAPEYIPDLILAALEGKRDAVFGSRLMNRGDAIKGGMPLYKFFGNQILSRFENIILGTKLYEFHSGYRMYSTNLLKKIPFEENTDDFHFDTQIIIQCRALGVDIFEVPIKTFYGEEECNVDGFKYAKDVVLSVLEYRLHQLHIIRRGRYFVNRDFVYVKKDSPYSSHEIILKAISCDKKKLLEFGGGSGLMYEEMTSRGFEVVCADDKKETYSKIPDASFISTVNNSIDDLGVGRDFDHIVLSDNLAKTVDDFYFLRTVNKYLKPDGTIVVVVPNISIWFYRLSLLIGRFNYDNRGILDRKNLHFYTKSTIVQLIERTGYRVEKVHYAGLPFELVFESLGKSFILRSIDTLYNLFVKLLPTVFAYQFIIEAKITHLNAETGEGKLL